MTKNALVWFCLFLLTVAIKLKHTNYKSHWNVLTLCEQWKIMSDLILPHGKMSEFILFSLIGFPLAIKLRNFDFESYSIVRIHFGYKTAKRRFWKSLNTLTFVDQNNYDVRFECDPWKNVWFCFVSIVWVYFSYKPEKFWFWESLKYLNVFWRKKILK